MASIFTPTVNKDISIQQSTILKWLLWMLIALVLIAALYSLYKKIVGNTDSIKVKPADYRLGGGDVSDSWLRNEMPSYVSELQSSLKSGWVWDATKDRCSSIRRAYEELNDNQLIAVHNSFAKTFKTTVRRRLMAVDDGCGFFMFGTSYGEQLIGRLNKLSLP